MTTRYANIASVRWQTAPPVRGITDRLRRRVPPAGARFIDAASGRRFPDRGARERQGLERLRCRHARGVTTLA